eukprot:c18828_g1_i1 orf=164-1345(-)
MFSPAIAFRFLLKSSLPPSPRIRFSNNRHPCLYPLVGLCHTVAVLESMDGTQELVAGGVVPLKRKSPPKVGTHNGTFHCDEALACFMLRMTEQFSNAEIIRTRDSKILNSLDAVLDVGGVYDADRFKFDHHQRGFDCTLRNGYKIKLSSAGLIYKHFGHEIIAKELGLDLSHSDVERVYLAVYRNFLEAIDAVDNGINQYDTDKQPRYTINTNLSARVGRLNLDWMEERSPEREDEAFNCAMELAGREFQDAVHYHARSWLPAREIVVDCITRRKEVDPSEEIMHLKRYVPWKEHIFEIEEELKVEPSIKYMLYQDGSSQQWRIQAVATGFASFQSRKPLPAAWRGLTGAQLSTVVGIEGCIFVHSTGFIGANASFEGVLEMARKALKSDPDE